MNLHNFIIPQRTAFISSSCLAQVYFSRVGVGWCGISTPLLWFPTHYSPQQSYQNITHFPSPSTFLHKYLHHLPHFHAAHPYAALPAVGITPDHGTAPSVTGLSRFFPGIISYQPLTFPPGLALSSSAPEQRSTARHNWGRYRSPMAASLQCFYPHPHNHLPPSLSPSLCLSLCALSLAKNPLPGSC